MFSFAIETVLATLLGQVPYNIDTVLYDSVYDILVDQNVRHNIIQHQPDDV